MQCSLNNIYIFIYTVCLGGALIVIYTSHPSKMEGERERLDIVRAAVEQEIIGKH